mgnify:CR=1 FL=1
MKLGFSAEQEQFRSEVSGWLNHQLSGPFADVHGLNLQTGLPERRLAWEQALGEARWSAIGWPEEYGGRGADLAEQVIFAEEYARAGGPTRLGHMGVELAGPTILHFGNDEQRRRFLPKIATGQEMWCQGYSEPGAGSDLSNVRTKATFEDGRWVVEGQKIWTSLAQFADWCFVVCRSEPGSSGRAGLTYLLVPMGQPGVEVRPIRQMTGDEEFNEVFFNGAVTVGENVVGEPGDGWQVAMGTLSFERGVSTLAQQMHFKNELNAIIKIANDNGEARNPLIRQRIAKAWRGLQIMRAGALRMLSGANSGTLSGPQYTYKIFWASWHRELGELAMDVMGQSGDIVNADYKMSELSRLFLFSRSDTIYAGTNQIQRNLIAERALGLPKEPRGSS